MRRRPLLAAWLPLGPPRPPWPSRPEVDALLVLAVDASGSIDADEFQLQREGYAEALSHPAVLAAIAAKPRGADRRRHGRMGLARRRRDGGGVDARRRCRRRPRPGGGRPRRPAQPAELERHRRCAGRIAPG